MKVLQYLNLHVDRAHNARPQITKVYVRKRRAVEPSPNEESMRGGFSGVSKNCN